jgi:hypothetical protein
VDARRSRGDGGRAITASEGTCHAHGEADGDGEDGEQQQVDWVLLAVEVERAEHWTPKLRAMFSNRSYRLLQFTQSTRPHGSKAKLGDCRVTVAAKCSIIMSCNQQTEINRISNNSR